MSNRETAPKLLFVILEVLSDVAFVVSVIGIVYYLTHATHP